MSARRLAAEFAAEEREQFLACIRPVTTRAR
jgi:hypothetical protein